jgi:hypothetical protein
MRSSSTDPALWILVIQNFPKVSAKMLEPVIYAISNKKFCASRHINVTLNRSATEYAQSVSGTCLFIYLFIYLFNS